jgi:hypothetical protein
MFLAGGLALAAGWIVLLGDPAIPPYASGDIRLAP